MSSDRNLSCPHCMNNVPWGARVCRGCHAEISYGTPPFIAITLTVLSVVAGFVVGKLFHDLLSITNSTVLWIVCGATTLLGWWFSFKNCRRFFRERTWFKRIYKT